MLSHQQYIINKLAFLFFCPGNVNRIYHNRIFNKVSMMFDPVIFMGPIAIATAIWYLPWQMAMTRLAYACKAELGLV